jgi:hypothetical protein
MYRRSVFTKVTLLPPYIYRDTVLGILHCHGDMIKLNPLVIKYERCDLPRHAAVDEFYCVWYELTRNIRYFPRVSGKVSYKACFYDLPTGLQTHVYAPTGLDIQEKWSVGGNMPGESREAVELGLTNVPREGLYLREDVNMRCSVFVSDFVKKTMSHVHEMAVQRLVIRADLLRRRKEDYMDVAGTTSTSENVVGFHPPSTVVVQPLPPIEEDIDLIPPPLRPAYKPRESANYRRLMAGRQELE